MITRRRFVRACASASAAMGVVWRPRPVRAQQLSGDWEFEGRPIGLPHCAAKLSWQDWDPAMWAKVWNYRRRFSVPDTFRGRRMFLEFEGVMTGATPSINGHALPEHLGGYLPFRYEISEWLKTGENLLELAVDSRWLNAPPEGSPKGPSSIDYLEPGGITRPVRLIDLPQAFLTDLFAKPVQVLDATRRVEVSCTIDSALAEGQAAEIEAALVDGNRVLSRTRRTVRLEKAGRTEAALTLSKLGNISVWRPDSPRLYEVVATLSLGGKPVHDSRTRIGFREARFETDGFFLNGSRFRIFGLNRHELFPYVGAAMPARVQRRDAEILRRDFHCNMVRCSHYPQSEAFLDACDELGLMVWEEPPGWQYIGDDAWKDLAVRDVHDMIVRDRNHPAIVIWGVRINESHNDPPLYSRTRELAHSLDDSRPTSGSMTNTSTENWRQDVFAFDDYHAAPDGTVAIHEPVPGVPFMLAETVGQFNYTRGRTFDAKYRRDADAGLQQAQAIRHAQAHDRAAAFPRCAGVIAWCGFDYGSLINSSRGVKYPGVADVFRIPKLGAAFYRSQVSPEVRPVILPGFYWDFGPRTPQGPGAHSAIFSNCDRLVVFVDGKQIADAQPDRAGFPHLQYPPFFCDLPADGSRLPELRIDGYVGRRVALSRSFSADPGKDRLAVAADDAELVGDGSDATRLHFETVDRFGAPRPFAKGEVSFAIAGPGTIVGDNPFPLTESGGVGAVWIRSAPGGSGTVVVTARHSSLGVRTVRSKLGNAGFPVSGERSSAGCGDRRRAALALAG